MPFLHITGVTPLGGQFDIGYCFMPGEKDFQYNVAIKFLREYLDLLGVNPKVVITDWETGLKKALLDEFPECEQRMCSWHLNKLILVEAIKAMDIRRGISDKEKAEIEEDRNLFMSRYEALRATQTEEEFDLQWEWIQNEYSEYPNLIKYLDNWIIVREQWAEFTCRFFRDYGNHCNSPNEGSHKVLKGHMSMPQGHPYNVVKDIHLMCKSWQNEYEAKLLRD
jgi:hypothetical protein